MKRKNKVMLALAIGAVALAIGSGVARCSLVTSEEGTSDAEVAEQGASIQPAGPSGVDEGSGQGAGAQGGFADLKNTSWESEDGKSALSIIEGAIIEKSEDGSTVLYYRVDEEDVSADVLTATLSVSSSMTGDEGKTVVLVRAIPDGGYELACDLLKARYALKSEAATDIKLADATDELFGSFGKTEQDFEEALLAYAKASAPSAKSAAWSGEVWIDFNEGTYLTNFVLDDAAATIVTVQMDASGRMGAL